MTTDPWEDPAALGREGLDLLLAVTTLLGEDMARDLRARGLTPSRVPVLWMLGHSGPSTQRALAEAVGVSARNITGLVDALVETGFVTREPHPTDRRAFLVTPTELGSAEVASLVAAYDELASQLFGDLHPEQLGVLVESLRDVAGRLEAVVDV